MDNLLTPEETRKAASGSPAAIPILEIYRLVEAGAQAYKEKIDKLAEPEKLREAITCELCKQHNKITCTTPTPDSNHWICKAFLEKADSILSLLTSTINQAKQEERKRIFSILDKSCSHTHEAGTGAFICDQCLKALKGDSK